MPRRPRIALAATALTAACAATPAGPPANPVGFGAPPAWAKYVVAPRSRDVRPVRVIAATAGVTNPDGALGRGVATLSRPRLAFTQIIRAYLGLAPRQQPPSLTVDFGQVVVGYPRIQFAGASANHPGLRLAFSETLEYLTEVSDFTRSNNGQTITPGTDQIAVAEAPSQWTGARGCASGTRVCADGLHGFRYLKISLDALPADAPDATPYGSVAIAGVALEFTAYLGTPDSYRGWFESSDDELNRWWYAASYTNELDVDTFRADDVDPRGADTAGLDGKRVLHDGAKRDRDPYVGDVAVSGRTAYVTHADGEPARNVLADLADHQRDDGWIAPASIRHYTLPLFDYPLWWVTSSWDYVLYTGDTAYARRYYPQLINLLDRWCPQVTDDHGLLAKGLHGTADYGDYAFLPRAGEVTYYNALYVRALRDAAQLAGALGRAEDAARWTRRATEVAAAINRRLWDPAAGAYLDSAVGPVRHGQDGNALAVVAGIADPARAASALGYLAAHTARPYGNAFMDNDTLVPDGSQRVYAFTSYPEIEARFLAGQTDSAIEEIRRLYGWMARHDPGITAWEGIGPGGSMYEQGFTSAAHGWSTGVVPALTNHLLGAIPTAPGFATWAVQPRPGSIAWARGALPTPHGALTVEWRQRSGAAGFTLAVTAPPGTSGTLAVPVDDPADRVWLDGSVLWDAAHATGHGATLGGGYLRIPGIGAGRHIATVDPACPRAHTQCVMPVLRPVPR